MIKLYNTLKCVFQNKSVLAHTDSLSDMAQPCDIDLTIIHDHFFMVQRVVSYFDFGSGSSVIF